MHAVATGVLAKSPSHIPMQRAGKTGAVDMTETILLDFPKIADMMRQSSV